MGEPVKVEVVGQVLPGSVLRMTGPLSTEDRDDMRDPVLDAIREAAGHDRFVVVLDPDVEVSAPPADGADTKRMAVAEFRALGLLQEVNRRLLHPLGLKLGWQTGMDEDVLAVWDDRGDPEGVRFEGIDLRGGAATVDWLWEDRRPAREAALGYMIQPVED